MITVGVFQMAAFYSTFLNEAGEIAHGESCRAQAQ